MKVLTTGLNCACFIFVLFAKSVFSQTSNTLNNNQNLEKNEKEGINGCPLEDGSIVKFGESRSLPGCKNLRCLKEENSFALIIESCEIAKDDIPPDCKVVPRPELQFPKCCDTVFHCTKVTTRVFPVVYTHENISQLERNDSINTLGINQPQIKEIISSDVIKRNNTEDVTRYKRELSRSLELQSSNLEVKNTEGCYTKNGFMNIGEEFVLPGCSKARCSATDEGVALVIASCPHDKEKLPKGCKLVPPETENFFPECCKAQFICVKKVIEFAPYKSSHTKLVRGNNSDNFTLGENNEEFNTSKEEIMRKLKKSSDSTKQIKLNSPNRINREISSQVKLNETIEESNDMCITENGTLFLGEVIPLPGCQEKKCLFRNGSYMMVHLGCDVDNVEVPEGCKILPFTSKQFPKCCEVVFSCEEVVTELFETVYTPYNISQMHLNDTKTLVESQNKSEEISGESFVDLEITKENKNNETNRTNTGREIKSTNNLNTITEQKIIGCPTETGIMRIGERTLLPNCSQLRCVSEKNGLSLMMVSCIEKEILIPSGCEIIPTSDSHYPACCQVTFKCVKEVVKIIPIMHTLDNITLSTKIQNYDNTFSNVTDEDYEDHTSNPSSEEAFPEEYLIFDNVESNSTEKSNFNKGLKQNNVLGNETEEGVNTEEFPVICLTPEANLKVGDTIAASGCGEIRCISSNNSTSLVLVKCEITEEEIPQGCTLVPQETLNFPSCCTARFECINITENEFPVTYTSKNISKIILIEEESLEEGLTKHPTPLKMPLRKERELKNSSYHEGEKLEERCYTENGTSLKKGETMTMKGCSQLRCVVIEGTVQLVTVGCAKDNVILREGCQIFHHSPSEEFPECCITEMDCVIPITYSKFNISQNPQRQVDKKQLPSNINYDFRKQNNSKYNKQKREKRDVQTSETESRKCVTSNSTLKVGESISLQNCAELKCISDNEIPTLIIVSCPLKQDQEKKGCKTVENTSLLFPSCCNITWVCEKIIEKVYPVVYTAANISEVPRNISENLITSLANDNNNVSQVIRHKREVQNSTEIKGCNVSNEILKSGQFIPLKNCARLECLASRDDFYLAVASCPPDKVTVPTGCKIVPKFDAPYPECCEVVMVCKKVTIKVIPVVYTAANISNIDINTGASLVNYSTIPVKDLELRMDTSETQKSRRILKARLISEGDSKTSNSSLPEEASKAESKILNKNDRVKRIQRKPDSKVRATTPKNETKPSFFLSSQKRTSRNRRIENDDKKANETIELKHTMFITVSPTEPQSSSSDNNTTFIPSKRRRLSSLLSSRNLRANTTPKSQTETKASKTVAKPENKSQTNRSKTGKKRKVSVDESKKTKKVNIEIKNKNETLPEKVVKRRNIYANRLNKFLAKIESNEKAKNATTKTQTKEEKPKIKKSLKKKSKKEKKQKKEKKPKKVKKKKKSSKSKKVSKKKTIKKPKIKLDTNSTLRRRLRPRTKVSLKLGKTEKTEVPKKNKKSEDKKKEESKTSPVRSRSNLNKKENLKEEKKKKDEKNPENEKKDKEIKDTNTRVQSRRKKLQKKIDDAKKVESKPKAKTTSRKRKTKPSFELKSTKEKTDEKKNDEKVTESDRGKVIFDVSKLKTNLNKTESTNQSTKTIIPSSRERGSRRRVIKPKDKLEEKEKDKKKESKEAKTIITEKINDITKKEEKKETTTPESLYKSVVKVTENEIVTISPDFESLYDSDYSFMPSSLADFDKFYKYPTEDLEISSSHKEDSKSPDTKENEIIDIPDPPKIPMKITTVSFSTSRRSYKSSKTRNTSKNFKETPPTYDKKETYQAETFKS